MLTEQQGITLSSLSELQLQLDAEIASLHAQIQELKRRRNALSPACILSPEILSSIFLIYRDDTLNTLTGDPDNFEWLAISEVCSWWRRVAHGCPILWNHLRCTVSHGYTLANQMADLAGNVPLCVSLQLDGCKSGMKWLTPAMMKRIQRLSLYQCPEDALLNDPHSALRQPALQLRRFRVHGGRFGGNMVHIPNDFLGGCLTKVSKAEFDFARLDWGLKIFFHNMRDLRIRSGTMTGTPESMIDALRNMIHLQRLRLDTSLDRNVQLPPPTTALITLPQLTHFSVSSHDIWVETLTRYLRAPKLQFCEIRNTWRLDSAISSASDFARLQQTIMVGDDQKFTCLKVDSYDLTLSSVSDPFTTQSKYQLSFGTRAQAVPWQRPVATSLNLSAIARLELRGVITPASMAALVAIAPALMTVEVIALCGVSNDILGKEFLNSEADRDHILFPLLKTVEIDEQVNIVFLLGWLRLRQKKGRELGSITLTSPRERYGNRIGKIRHWVGEIIEKA
jgi:hypothetical protein